MGRLGRLFDTGISLLEGVIERIGDPDLVRCSRQRHLRLDSEWVTARERIADLEDQLDALVGERDGQRKRTEFLERELRGIREQLLNQSASGFVSLVKVNVLATIEDALAGHGYDRCTCDARFMTAEDYRDHLPCEGPT